jgi:hypothetical protein
VRRRRRRQRVSDHSSWRNVGGPCAARGRSACPTHECRVVRTAAANTRSPTCGPLRCPRCRQGRDPVRRRPQWQRRARRAGAARSAGAAAHTAAAGPLGAACDAVAISSARCLGARGRRGTLAGAAAPQGLPTCILATCWQDRGVRWCEVALLRSGLPAGRVLACQESLRALPGLCLVGGRRDVPCGGRKGDWLDALSSVVCQASPDCAS